MLAKSPKMSTSAPRPELASLFEPAATASALRKQRPVIVATLVVYAVIQFLYITATPLQTIGLPDNLPQEAGSPSTLLVGTGPDEKEYLLYIMSLADRQALPASSPKFRRSPEEYVSYQVQHPPLFFSFAALLYRLVTPLAGLAAYWYTIRAVCAVCGACAVFFASRAAAIAFPASEFIVYAAPPALAFLPIFGHMCGNLSSEPLEMAIAAVAWFQMIGMVRQTRPRTTLNAALLGVTLALAALSKLTAVIYIPAAVLALTFPLKAPAEAQGTPVSRLSAFFAPLIVLLFPWFFHNKAAFGEWFPRPFNRPQLAGFTLWDYLSDVNQLHVYPGLGRPFAISPAVIVLMYGSTSWTPFWLVQYYLPGGLDIALVWQLVLVVPIVISLLMLFLHMSRSSRKSTGHDSAGRVIVWMAGMTVAFAIAGVLQQQLYADWNVVTSAGRYFVAAAPVGTLVLVFSISTGLRGSVAWQRVAVGIFAAIMLFLDVFTVLAIRDFYVDHPQQPSIQRAAG